MNRLSGVRRRCVRAFALIVIAVLAAVTATAATFAGSGVGLIPTAATCRVLHRPVHHSTLPLP